MRAEAEKAAAAGLSVANYRIQQAAAAKALRDQAPVPAGKTYVGPERRETYRPIAQSSFAEGADWFNRR